MAESPMESADALLIGAVDTAADLEASACPLPKEQASGPQSRWPPLLCHPKLVQQCPHATSPPAAIAMSNYLCSPGVSATPGPPISNIRVCDIQHVGFTVSQVKLNSFWTVSSVQRQ